MLLSYLAKGSKAGRAAGADEEDNVQLSLEFHECAAQSGLHDIEVLNRATKTRTPERVWEMVAKGGPDIVITRSLLAHLLRFQLGT